MLRSSSRSHNDITNVVALRRFFQLPCNWIFQHHCIDTAFNMKKCTTVSICIVTLYFVITGCGGKSTTCFLNKNPFCNTVNKRAPKIQALRPCGKIPSSLSTTTACKIANLRGVRPKPLALYLFY